MGRKAKSRPAEIPGRTEFVLQFRERLRGQRTASGLTQKELSVLASAPRATIARYERGGVLPDLLFLVDRIAEVLSVDPGWLAFGTGDPPGSTLPTRKNLLGTMVLEDAALEPTYPRRSRFLFDATATANPGDLVVVRLGNGKQGARILRSRLNDQDENVMALVPLNPDFVAETFSLEEFSERLVGRVVEVRLFL